jgi:tetratricopeptide (TPR) repeat protein
MRALMLPLLVTGVLASRVAGQDTTSTHHDSTKHHATHDSSALRREIHAGDSLDTARKPEPALAHYRAAIALDSLSDEALWKAARSIVDVAKQIDVKDDAGKKRRDSMYVEARALSERATKINPKNADAHAMIAQALGRLSRTRGGKERVRFAKIIYDEAMLTLSIDSTNDIAYHVLGAWNAEIKRLSGMTRFFAKTLFGAGFMDKANWDDAQRYLERAVALRPNNVYHHLELAEVYVDVKKYTAARAQLTAIADLANWDYLDPKYKEDAVELLAEIKDKQDKS